MHYQGRVDVSLSGTEFHETFGSFSKALKITPSRGWRWVHDTSDPVLTQVASSERMGDEKSRGWGIRWWC